MSIHHHECFPEFFYMCHIYVYFLFWCIFRPIFFCPNMSNIEWQMLNLFLEFSLSFLSLFPNPHHHHHHTHRIQLVFFHHSKMMNNFSIFVWKNKFIISFFFCFVLYFVFLHSISLTCTVSVFVYRNFFHILWHWKCHFLFFFLQIFIPLFILHTSKSVYICNKLIGQYFCKNYNCHQYEKERENMIMMMRM